VPVLVEYLDVVQLRLGAAEQLAPLAEPRALKALEATRADAKASPDDRARATVALAGAGHQELAPAVRELLASGRENSYAAAALARLHDAAARPVLVEQLAVPSLRVGAARALRILDPAIDGALLPPLAAALASAKDTERAQVAETLLLLAGPPAWARAE
jgi:hypothetical protein